MTINFYRILPINIILILNCFSCKINSQEKNIISTGTIKSLVNGDLMCYVTLIDKNGKENILGASFEICEQENLYLNNEVKLTYELANINDCQSNEPCGKTRQESIITAIEIIGKN